MSERRKRKRKKKGMDIILKKRIVIGRFSNVVRSISKATLESLCVAMSRIKDYWTLTDRREEREGSWESKPRISYCTLAELRLRSSRKSVHSSLRRPSQAIRKTSRTHLRWKRPVSYSSFQLSFKNNKQWGNTCIYTL